MKRLQNESDSNGYYKRKPQRQQDKVVVVFSPVNRDEMRKSLPFLVSLRPHNKFRNKKRMMSK